MKDQIALLDVVSGSLLPLGKYMPDRGHVPVYWGDTPEMLIARRDARERDLERPRDLAESIANAVVELLRAEGLVP